MRTMMGLLLGFSLMALATGTAVATPAGFRRVVACPPGSDTLVIPSTTDTFGGQRYEVPCGYYGRVGINQYVYYGPAPPIVSRPGLHRYKHPGVRHHRKVRHVSR